MYAVIKDNTVMAYAHWAFSKEAVEVDIDYNYFTENEDQFKVINGILTDISDTEEYKAKKLEEAKTLKHDENKQKRDERLRSGVEYKGVKFDSDTDSKVNIMGALSALADDETVGWNSMSNETIILTKAELEELGALLIGLTSAVWGEEGLNVQYINAINACTSLEELEAVVIDYTQV